MAKNQNQANLSRVKKNNKKKNSDFLVVGVGASAGGIKPLEDLLDSMPTDPDIAFVVVLHLSPEYESNLSSLLQRRIKLRLSEVTESSKIEPNHVFVIPPGKHLVIEDGYVAVAEPDQRRGMRVP